MPIAGVLASNAYQQDFGQLTSALASNDLAGARQAFQSLHAAPSGGSQFVGLPLPAPIRTDLDHLSTALQKGDMKAAQTAFSNLVADLTAQYQTQAEDSGGISLLG
jgi:hypothetical protein